MKLLNPNYKYGSAFLVFTHDHRNITPDKIFIEIGKCQNPKHSFFAEMIITKRILKILVLRKVDKSPIKTEWVDVAKKQCNM